MRGVMIGATLAFAVGCGPDSGIILPDVHADAGTVQEPPPPPGPIHQGPNDITIPLGETEEFTVGGVKFSILRNTTTSGTLIARNHNSNSAKVIVDMVNGGGGVFLDETFLGNNEAVSNNSLDLSPGANLRFSVKVWKSGLDFATCSFTSDTCYSSSEKKTFIFYEK